MAYVNPLHPPVRSSQRSHYSSLGDAAGATVFLSSSRRRLPLVPFTPSSKWDLAMGQHTRLHGAIQFNHIGYNSQGVQMRELSARSTGGLGNIIAGANDLVLAHTGRERIMLRIIWPGYEHVEWTYNLDLNVGGRPITRAQLGVVVAQNFARFVEKTRSEPSCSREWNLSSSGTRFEHLVLIALVNVWEGVWQADIAIDLR
ncbi:hypothetical protein DXG01_005173 [Tephrocybe rancida]|nr:hypothetical protein DXG01_005173 [Tephrocybe rancida]